MNDFIYKKITQKDRDQLKYLLEKDARYSNEWWSFDVYWKKRYGYSLRVQLIFDFIEKLIVPSGKGKGKPFKLRDFQKNFIRNVYGPIKTNKLRTVIRAILSIGRKNGKTMLLACIILVHLVGPEATVNGEIFSVANSREQASKVFKYAAQIVRADSELGQHIKIVDSTKTMVCYGNGSAYKALAAEAGTNFGENPTLIVYDELAQAKNRALYDAMDTAMGARLESGEEGEEPLFVTISTQSNDPQHILSQLIDDGLSGHDPTTICHLYTLSPMMLMMRRALPIRSCGRWRTPLSGTFVLSPKCGRRQSGR